MDNHHSKFILGASQQTWVKYALLPMRKESTYVLYKCIHLTVLIGKRTINIHPSCVTHYHAWSLECVYV